MSSTSSSTRSSSISSSASMTWQTRLLGECQRRGWRTPRYEMCSDRRGGRTAWSSTVEVNGKAYQARYWYDGTYSNNAKEDAAEVALIRMGLVAAPQTTYRT
ncbi:hypothetical protein K461DRAFT_276213 [Myriangium duriaei CBS 260.36]|uniref:DRBM domain-containing protein n=1 Tax=Myriangium duriaei CBS 260.36 TaxID=1168546 RepID=A0A9P4J9R7_9PEZI|nr:hypothetical protein K461DRAFT_276213 [Myriangium duriaei CBS 260.36]